MLVRLRYLIIAALALAYSLSAQIAPQSGNQKGTPARPSRSLPLPGGVRPGEPIVIQADQIRATLTAGHRLYQADGAVTIDVADLRLSADHMSYDSGTGEATAVGHVAFDSESEHTHIEGARASYNFTASTGEFDDFHGVSGLQLRGRQATAFTNNPLVFSGSKLLRLGVEHYRLLDGSVTSCALPNPKWELTASQADIELGKNAKLYHATFHFFDLPVFYAPFLTHSTTREGRHSGVLVPVISKSNIKGYIVGDSFYWAAARNLNITAGGEYYSARGWADHLAIEGLPTRNSAFNLQLDGVLDRGLALSNGARLRQGGQELRLSGNHESESGFRSVIDVDYISSYLYRLVFNNSFADAINSEAISTAFTEKESDGRDFAVVAHRYQDFLGTSPHASLSLASLPSADWNAYAQPASGSLPIYFSWDATAGLLDRSEPGFATGLMSRMDVSPEMTVPVHTPAGDFTADVSVRSSYYSEKQDAASAITSASPPQLIAGSLWRNSADADLEWRPPAIERVFDSPSFWPGHRLKHVFEPDFAYHFTGGVDDPNEIIRFDERDILADTSEIEYGFTNRLLAAGSQPGQSRELVSWTVEQKYFFDPTFGGALLPGARNLFLTTELLSPFDVEALPLRFSPLSSVVRVSPFANFDGEWRLDYDSHDHQVAASAFTGDFHFGKAFFSGSHYLLRPPPGIALATSVTQFNQLRLAAGYGNAAAPGNSLAAAAAYDAATGRLQYTTLQASHNWDCCGFSLEYRRFSLASVRRENQFLISITLSNVATFGNLKRQDRLF